MNDREAAREAIARFESGESDLEEFIDSTGNRTFLIRDPEDPRFFRIEAETEGRGFVVTMTGMSFPAAEVRPLSLPADVPFIPGTPTVVMISPSNGSTLVRWDDPEDPDRTFSKIREQLLESGWSEVMPEPSKQEGPGKALFTRENIQRTLTILPGAMGRHLVMATELRDDDGPV